jgi:hypothetical protein
MIAHLMCLNCGKRGVCAESFTLCGRCKGADEAKVNTNVSRRMPKRPTMASPGTEAKIQVMRRRAERGEHLYHPLDNRSCYRPIKRGPRVKCDRESQEGSDGGGIITTLLGYRMEEGED